MRFLFHLNVIMWWRWFEAIEILLNEKLTSKNWFEEESPMKLEFNEQRSRFFRKNESHTHTKRCHKKTVTNIELNKPKASLFISKIWKSISVNLKDVMNKWVRVTKAWHHTAKHSHTRFEHNVCNEEIYNKIYNSCLYFEFARFEE